MARLGFRDNIHRFFKMIQMHKGFGRPTVFHALVVIFAEFFAWGLLATPTIAFLEKTFPGQTLMMNGLIWGIKVGLQIVTLARNLPFQREYTKKTNLFIPIIPGNSIFLDEPANRLFQ